MVISNNFSHFQANLQFRKHFYTYFVWSIQPPCDTGSAVFLSDLQPEIPKFGRSKWSVRGHTASKKSHSSYHPAFGLYVNTTIAFSFVQGANAALLPQRWSLNARKKGDIRRAIKLAQAVIRNCQNWVLRGTWRTRTSHYNSYTLRSTYLVLS